VPLGTPGKRLRKHYDSHLSIRVRYRSGMALYPSDFVEPCLPTISRTVPTGPQWQPFMGDWQTFCWGTREQGHTPPRARTLSRAAGRYYPARVPSPVSSCWTDTMVRDTFTAIGAAVLAVGTYELLSLLGAALVGGP
jgi:hypothetical protein